MAVAPPPDGMVPEPRDGDEYDRAKLPPATPVTIDPHADPVPARELAMDSGDSEAEGDVVADPPRGEIDLEREAALSARSQMDGAGEETLDAAHPAPLLPPD